MRVSRYVSVVFVLAGFAMAGPFTFTTGSPDGRMGAVSQQAAGASIESETADDFILSAPTIINGATFTGLIPSSGPGISDVTVEIYQVFPVDSTNPPSGNVPTRVNSPSDVAFDSRDSGAATLTYLVSALNPSFAVANTVINGIDPSPSQTTGGEGPATGIEDLFTITFTTPFSLPAGHYFFVPQVRLASGNFLWLSTSGPAQFTGDLQAWIRNANLQPDWLRIGTDIVGGEIPPKFDMAFSLTGETVPEPSTAALLAAGVLLLGWRSLRRS